jgi:uncharacterized protein (DUF3084 family)
MENPGQLLAEIQVFFHLAERMDKTVAALDDLTAAVAALTTQVQDVLAQLGQGVTSAEAENVVSELNNLAASIQAALNPPQG